MAMQEQLSGVNATPRARKAHRIQAELDQRMVARYVRTAEGVPRCDSHAVSEHLNEEIWR